MMTKATVFVLSTIALVNCVAGSNYTDNYDNSDTSSGYSSYNSDSDVYGVNFFAESDSTYYDGYQQAWRYLGWYVACGSPSDRYYDNGSGSHDSNDNQRYQGNMYCQRYLMWAAVSSYLLSQSHAVSVFH